MYLEGPVLQAEPVLQQQQPKEYNLGGLPSLADNLQHRLFIYLATLYHPFNKVKESLCVLKVLLYMVASHGSWKG